MPKRYGFCRRSYINDAKDKASTLLKAAETEAENRKQHILDAAQTEDGELVISALQSSQRHSHPGAGPRTL